MMTTTDTMQLTFDILSFDDSKSLNAWLYLEGVIVEEVSIE